MQQGGGDRTKVPFVFFYLYQSCIHLLQQKRQKLNTLILLNFDPQNYENNLVSLTFS